MSRRLSYAPDLSAREQGQRDVALAFLDAIIDLPGCREEWLARWLAGTCGALIDGSDHMRDVALRMAVDHLSNAATQLERATSLENKKPKAKRKKTAGSKR